jgi:thymidylate synthase (FAD)
MAHRMLKHAKAEAPALFEHAGPACVSGPCNQGKMSCGRPWPTRKDLP